MRRLVIEAQPDELTCGPTALHAVYRYYGHQVSLDEVIGHVPMVAGGGTLGPLLGQHALRAGFKATLHTCNLQIFDPTWFEQGVSSFLIQKLESQMRYKGGSKIKVATRAYAEFCRLGGELRLGELTPELFRRYLARGKPLLVGLSATFLYRTAREFGPNCDYDDLRGEPSGHFVVLTGFDEVQGTVTVADPLRPNPMASLNQTYQVDIHRVIGAIYLGVLTYDGNVLAVEYDKNH